MINSNNLYFNISNAIVISPKLQQAIKILQYNNLELSEFIKDEFEKNPFINLKETKPNYKNYSALKNTFIENIEYKESFYQNIMKQINIIFQSNILRKIAFHLLDNLDKNGFIEKSSQTISSETGHPEALIESVIKKLQLHITPVGVFTRNIKECLTLKLQEKYQNNIPIGTILALDNINEINQKTINNILKACKKHNTSLIDGIHDLLSIGFYPNIPHSDKTDIRIPDIIISKITENTWNIELNSETLPSVVMNEEYKTIIKKHKNQKEEKNFYKKNINAANFLIKAINQRADTILSIAKEIFHQQEDFFRKGPDFLKPLTLKNIAEEINVHESTVSRAVSNKYIMTEFGVLDFKYFFSSKNENALGQSISSNVIKQKIQFLINNEDKFCPYSDDKIAELLSENGINVARRTIAKYREAINIPSSNKRKKIKNLYKI